MDSLIKRFDSSLERDLIVCRERGVAYQANMRARSVKYDDEYYKKVDAYEGSAIAIRVNNGRCALLERHLEPGRLLLDYGTGTLAFLKGAVQRGYITRGFEVLPRTVKVLKELDLFSDSAELFDALTMWDVIEHLDMPELVLNSVQRGALFFASLPIFNSFDSIRDSKHYRPGEHLYYWTRAGFIAWMAMRGFRCLEFSNHEVEAGRESIGAFAFKRDLPDYHDHIAAYKEMHATRYYGGSSTELHLSHAAAVVSALRPGSIIDFGCGRSDLVSHFWNDGQRRIARYDPAIGAYESMPAGTFDLAFCCDVLEHVPIASIDRVLTEVRKKSLRALFTISTKLARAKLPDGRNAHVTLLTKTEWVRWIASYFGSVKELVSAWEHELILVAGKSPGLNGKVLAL